MAAPVTLFTVPPPDKYVIPLQIFYSYTFGTTPYTDIVCITADSTGEVLNNLAGIDITKTTNFAGYLGAPEFASSTLSGAPLVIRSSNSSGPGTGDGTLAITLFYVLEKGI